MGSVREEIDNYLRAEMVTLGTNIDDAKTGQMWAFDSERLSKGALSLVCKRIEGDEILERVLQKEFAQLYVRDMEAMSNGTERPAPLTVIREILQAYRQAIIDVIKEK